MIHYSINKAKFKFEYLPEYAEFLLQNKLTEYVTVGIRFCREADLPILKPLSKFSEEELVALSIESNREILLALSKNEIAGFIEKNTKTWIENSIGIIDKDEVTAEDLTLIFYIRRKIFTHFLDSYTKNLVEQKFILGELDSYTTQEELISLNIFIQMQKQKFQKVNEELEIKGKLLEETQAFVETGSYLINYTDPSKSIFTMQYRKILEFGNEPNLNDFVNKVHPEDRAAVMAVMDTAYAKGGEVEVEYRYIGAESEKRIWTKGVVELSDGKPVLLKGIIRDVTKKYNLIQQFQENEKRHQQAQELTLLGNWSWSLSSDLMTLSDEMYKIYGVKKGTPITLSQAVDFVHPDDRERIKKQMENIQDIETSREQIFKIINAQGVEKILHGISRVETNRNNTIVRVFGTCQDITRSHILKEVLIS